MGSRARKRKRPRAKTSRNDQDAQKSIVCNNAHDYLSIDGREHLEHEHEDEDNCGCEEEDNCGYEEEEEHNEDEPEQPTSKKPRLLYDRIVEYTFETIPAKLRKFWKIRNRLWTYFDRGILMDEEGWYSVTPEEIAWHIAKRCNCDTIIDAFCGVGGNAIQFAYTCNRVIAIDNDEVRLACAKHNAKIYGVENKIEFILGDYLQLVPRLKADAVFLSPPWGGIDYSKRKTFDIKTQIIMDGERIYHETRKITNNIAYYLPKTVNPRQLAKLAGKGNTVEIEEVYVKDRHKSIVAYFGDLAKNDSEQENEVEYVEDWQTVDVMAFLKA